MATTLFDEAARERIIARLDRLTPDARPRWGSMPATHLPPHLIDAFEMCFAEVEHPQRSGFFGTALGRFLVLKLPIPRGRITAPPEFHLTQPGDFAADRERAKGYLHRFADGPDQRWGVSPVFGKLSPKQWARLHYVHTDHHLTQFGC